MRFWNSLVLAMVAIVLAGTSTAGELALPQGRVLLTVSGEISNHNGEGGTARFDRAMLESLDWQEVETYTSFTEGPQVFAGPSLRSLLEAVGATGSILRASAINDYSVEFEAALAAEHDVFLAMVQNGKVMRVRDKGPIWVVFPLSEEEVAFKPFDNEMIWQLDRIEVRD